MNYHTLASLRADFKDFANKLLQPEDTSGVWATSKEDILDACAGMNPFEATRALEMWLTHAMDAEQDAMDAEQSRMEDRENHIRLSGGW
jgi:hypothetical protein